MNYMVIALLLSCYALHAMDTGNQLVVTGANKSEQELREAFEVLESLRAVGDSLKLQKSLIKAKTDLAIKILNMTTPDNKVDFQEEREIEKLCSQPMAIDTIIKLRDTISRFQERKQRLAAGAQNNKSCGTCRIL